MAAILHGIFGVEAHNIGAIPTSGKRDHPSVNSLEAMERNVEIKARVADLPAVSARAQAIADHAPRVLDQEDTFFRCRNGRLKLRRCGDGGAELIYYLRPNRADARESRYMRSACTDPDALARVLAGALGIRGVVRKQRTLLFAGRIRIHLDRVEALGDFVEVEVVLRPEESIVEGACAADGMMKLLDIDRGKWVAESYIDLLVDANP